MFLLISALGWLPQPVFSGYIMEESQHQEIFRMPWYHKARKYGEFIESDDDDWECRSWDSSKVDEVEEANSE